MEPLRLLFETQEAACEVAFMLRCEYDGCTLVTLPPMHDPLALRTAIELTGADFCFEGDHYPLILPQLSEIPISLSDETLPDRITRKAQLWCDRPLF